MAQSIFLAVGLIRAGGFLFSVFPTALFAGQKLKEANILSLFGTAVQLVSFALAIWKGLGLWAYPLSLLFAQVVITGLQVRLTSRAGLLGVVGRETVDFGRIRTLLRLGVDVFVVSLFGAIMGNSLLLLSGHLLTLEATAMLAVNLKLVSLITQILQRIPGSATPALMKMVSENSEYQFHVWWRLLTKLTIFATILCAGGFILWNHLIVENWANSEMILNPLPIILLSLIPFRYLFHNQFVGSLTIFKEIRKVNLWLIWEVTLYFILALYLGGRFGLDGLLAANLLSLAGGASVGGVKWMAVYMKLPFRDLAFMAARVVLPLSAAFLILVTTYQLVPNAGFTMVSLLSFLWCLMSGAIVYFLVFDHRERARLTELLKTLRRSKRRLTL